MLSSRSKRPKIERMKVEVEPMEVIAAHLTWSNPSRGRHDVPKRRSLSFSGRKGLADAMLDGTVANECISLRELVQLHLNEDGKRLASVRAAAPEDPWNEGTTIQTLIIELAGGKEIDLGDRRGLSLQGQGFEAFTEAMQNHGVDRSGDLEAERIRR